MRWCGPASFELLGDSRFHIFYNPRDLSPEEFGEREEEELLVTEERFFAFQDPVKIPALRELIDEGLQRRRREQVKRRTRRWSHLSSPMSIEHLTTSRPVPLDTIYLILDRLSWEDIPNVLVAFGWCQIPDRYWYARLEKSCKELLFELDDLIKVKAEEEDTGISVYWKLVCLGMEELLMPHLSPTLKVVLYAAMRLNPTSGPLLRMHCDVHARACTTTASPHAALGNGKVTSSPAPSLAVLAGVGLDFNRWTTRRSSLGAPWSNDERTTRGFCEAI
ncbi:hypothetical protein VTN00DRAFT_1450 [Thermoascus crustaceus]|uniref:uncharacterized protein n=1 Tax=Thermoascus crustaceus TaxID=5088 RepID=UPI003743FA13